MEGDLIHVDLPAMAAQHGVSDEFQYVRQLRVTTEAGRVLLHLEASVSA